MNSGAAQTPSPNANEPWIGIADVMPDLKLTERKIWERIRALKIPVFDRKAKMMDVRFRRSDWDAAVKANLQPLPERASLPPRTVPVSRPPKAAPKPVGNFDRLRRA